MTHPFNLRKNSQKGFTLIELLVVIAIIGVLASIVLASLNSARAKSRDARRLSDIKQLQLALELYFDGPTNEYPPGSITCSLSVNYGMEALVTGNYIPQVPKDPLSGNTDATAVCYTYASGVLTGATARTSYHITATLEDANNSSLNGDRDCDSTDNTPRCAGTADGTGAGGATFTGATRDGGNDSTNRRYDVTP